MSHTAPAANVMQEFDTEFLCEAPELYIFSACRHIVELLRAAPGPKRSGRKPRGPSAERTRRLLAQLAGLAQATQRFDIVLPFTPETGFAPSFWRWYNWWHDYRQSLTPDELELVHRLQDACDPEALEYRPRGDWVSYRATAAVKGMAEG